MKEENEEGNIIVRDHRRREQPAHHESVGDMLKNIDERSSVTRSLQEEINDCFMVPGPERIVVLPDRFQYKGKLFIPDTGKRAGTTGTILRMGDGEPPTFEGKHLQVGDRIAYGTWTGTQFSFDQRPSYRILGFHEVASVITDKAAKLLDVEA